jgi:hypothetical protein
MKQRLIRKANKQDVQAVIDEMLNSTEIMDSFLVDAKGEFSIECSNMWGTFINDFSKHVVKMLGELERDEVDKIIDENSKKIESVFAEHISRIFLQVAKDGWY